MFKLKIILRPLIIFILLSKLLFLLIFYLHESFLQKFLLFFKKEIKVDNIEKKIRYSLEKLGPIFIKFGQMLSTRSDIIPEKLSAELKKLRTHVKPVKFEEIKKIIEKELNNKIENIFEKVNENPLTSASIAQIHSAILKDNEKVVIKVLKPDIKFIILIDIFILRFFAYFLHNFFIQFERFKPMDIINELQNILEDEINFNNEIANLIKMRNNFQKNKFIYIPKIYWEFFKKNIFVMEYIDGITITNKTKLVFNNFDLNFITKNLIDLFYLQSFKHRFFHADLHPGNIFISKNEYNEPIIILIDFGIVSSLEKNEVFYLAENILAFTKKDYKRIAILHLKAGTILTDKTVYEIENEICCVFEPMLNKEIKDINFKTAIKSVMNLGSKFNLQIQPQLILFQRTLLTVESLCRDLSPNLNIWNSTRLSIEKNFFKEIALERFLFRIKSFLKNFNKKEKNKIKKNKKKNNEKKKIENKILTRKPARKFSISEIFFSNISGGLAVGYIIGMCTFLFIIQDYKEFLNNL